MRSAESSGQGAYDCSDKGLNMRELGIYVHIPFCVRKCEYCDFLSAPAGQGEMEDYVEMLCREIRERPEGKKECLVTSVFFGGGTPSVLPVESTEKILNTIREEFILVENAEITTEVNPGTVCKEKLRAYRDMGFERLSFGLQSADNGELKLLGRIHSWEDFLENYKQARAAGFSNINVDLMAALPGQTRESFQMTLKKVLGIGPSHLSVYSLIIEEGTPFYEKYGEDALRREDGFEPIYLPSEEAERSMYKDAVELLEAAGLKHYEISNYAREGEFCRHNDNCWKRVEYLGFGIGAASFFEEERFSCHRDLKRYLAGDFIPDTRQKLSVKEQMEETMFLGLRRMEGVSVKSFEKKFGVPMDKVYGKQLDKFMEKGLLDLQNGYVFLTDKGLDLANYVMAGFLFDE